MEHKSQLRIIKRLRRIYWFALIYSSQPHIFFFLRKYQILTSNGFCKVLKKWNLKIVDLDVLYSMRPNKDSSFNTKSYYWYKHGNRRDRYDLLVAIMFELKQKTKTNN